MYLNRRAVLTGLLAAPALNHAVLAGLKPVPVPVPLPRWQRFAVAPPPSNGHPTISIIVDDLGVIHPGTPRAVALPGPLTLAWFPFARNLPEQVAAATERGHE